MDSSAPVSASATATRLSLTFDTLFEHIQRLIKEEQDDSSDASLPDPRPQQRVDQARVSQFQAITATLNAALTHHYPLRPWHKSAIRRYINDVMDALDHVAAHRARHTSEAVTPASRSPTQSPTKASTMLNKSPTRIVAYQTAQSARQLDKKKWDYLCSSISDALRCHCTIRNSTEKTDTYTEKRLCFYINEFLDNLQESRSTFQSLYSHLQSSSLNFEVCSAAIIRTLDRLIAEEIPPSNDEAVAYVIYHLPAANSSHDRSDNNPELEHHFAAQLRRTYHGDAPLRFLRFVLNVKERSTIRTDPDGPIFNGYLKGTSIVQSSGTGKTRMVLELGGLAPLLYICVRSKKPSQTPSIHNGYPLAEENLYEFFYDSTRDTKASYDLQVAVFIRAYFEELTTRLQSCHTIEEKYKSLSQLNDFGGPGEPQRKPFFQLVIASARSKLDSALQSLTSQSTGRQDVFVEHLDQAACSLSDQLRQVQEHLYQRHLAFYQAHGISEVPVFVAFDECVQLIIKRSGPHDAENPQDHQLSSLRRAWHHLLQLEHAKGTVTFWLVLLSTNTGAVRLIEPKEHQASVRARDTEPLPVFVGLGYDVLRSENRMLTSPQDVCQAAQVCSYGRPLWDSLPRENLWDIAQFKLLGATKFDALDPVICYNILASRLALQLVPGHFGELFGRRKALATTSVDRHMRILIEVVDHTGLTIDSPSEPPLALAASRILLTTPIEGQPYKPAAVYAKVIETFTRHCLCSLDVQCLKGSQGEFITRLALMAAWDAFKLGGLQRARENRRGSEFLSEPVDLQSFLNKVAILNPLGQTLLQQQLDRVYSNVGNRLDACHESDGKEPLAAWVNFSHFDALPQGISQISPDYLWYCWKRGVALQMAHGQAGIDGIIPVFVGRLSQKFKRGPSTLAKAESAGAGMQADQDKADGMDEGEAARQMTYIAWESKFREEALGSEDASKAALAGPQLLQAACDAAEQSLQPPITPCGLLTILADLGTAQKFKRTNNTRPQLEVVSPPHGRPAFLRLWIRGIQDPSVYPCFDDLGIRDTVNNLFEVVKRSVPYEEDNKVMMPLWNAAADPEARKRVSENQPAILNWPSPFGPFNVDVSGQPMDLE